MKVNIRIIARHAHNRYKQTHSKFKYRDFESIYTVLMKKIESDLSVIDIYVPSFGIIRRSGNRFRIRFSKVLEKYVMRNLMS